MRRTSVSMLLATGAFFAAISAILTWRFYGHMVNIPVALSLSFWLLAIACVVIGRRVKTRIGDGLIGQDRSQLNPVVVAYFMALGKTCAWAGAVFAGVYLGIGAYVLPQVGVLLAAADDAPGVFASALGAIVLSAAGLYLEKCCEVPPSQSGDAIG